MAAHTKDKDHFILGLDYGTSYAGLGIIHVASFENGNQVETVMDWPGSNYLTYEKVASEHWYELASHTSGVKRNIAGKPVNGRSNDKYIIRWGCLLKPDEPRLQCLKLRLDPRQKLPPYVSTKELDGQLLQFGKTVEEAVSDYLGKLFEHFKQWLETRFPEMAKTTPIDVVLTVPAVWSDAAKDATMRAAEKAVLCRNLSMISEPEAAIVYAMKSIDQKQKLFKTGDNWILCDAGGGTVDLISYEVESLSPLRLKESAPGTGALCGGVFLNLKFQDLVKCRMGAKAFETLRKKKPKAWGHALRYFEDYVKKNFDPLNSQMVWDDNKFYVPLPGAPDNPAAGIEDSTITLTMADVAEIFRHPVQQVIDLVERQRNVLVAYGKIARGVILVGGFGQSGFLFRSLKARFADEDPPPLYTPADSEPAPDRGPRFMVLRPEHPWTAVVRGAVLTGLERDLVTSRKARRAYGVKCDALYDPSKHSEDNKYKHKVTLEDLACNQIKWHVTKGQDLPTATPIELDFITDWHADGFQAIQWTSIIVSDAETAPQEYVATAQTRVLCSIKADLTEVPRALFEERTIRGAKYTRLEHTIGMTFESGQLKFDLRKDGKVYGSIKAKYE